MSLRPGTHLGPYEIQTALGAGGMGEVYRARDTRLDRTVAIKVLPAELNTDPERRARFEREARAVAALAHPHICTLHDIGTHEGATYLVMEHLAGETLAQRLRKGALRLPQALEIGAQVAEALDAAHKHGIVHRDLKPGNVMLTASSAGRSRIGTVKLLDFGLAKLRETAARPAASQAMATEPLTRAGEMLGTRPYMAPEQVEGKATDARTDLWALGCVLYEMVAGRPAFAGDSVASITAAILAREPEPLATREPLTPPALEHVVRKCLAKQPDQRWDSAHDVAEHLRWVRETSGVAAPPGLDVRNRQSRQLVLAVIGALVAATIGAGAGWHWHVRASQAPLSPVHVSLDVRPAEALNGGGPGPTVVFTRGGSRTALAWTPDGQALVFVGRRGGVQQLYVRRLDAAESRPLPNTEGAQALAMSADSQWVAFWADGAIKKVPIGGGLATDLASGVSVPRGLAWDDRGRVFFGHPDGRIWAIPPDGTPAAVTTVGEEAREHGLPWLLPGGEVLLYTERRRQWSWGDEEVVAQTLATGVRTVLLKDAADARYVATGHLVFLRRGVLLAVPFDAERLAVHGTPVPVLDTVAQSLTGGTSNNITGAGQFAVAPTGALAWVASPVVPYPDSRLVTVDRHGRVTPLAAPVRSYTENVRVSPEGRRLAVGVQTLSEVGLWVSDLDRGNLSPLNRDGEVNWLIWTPDGLSVLYDWLSNGRFSLAAQRADGTAPPRDLLTGSHIPVSFTPDGRHLAALRSGEVVTVTVENGQASVEHSTDVPEVGWWPEISPDGRWLAYGSWVSGQLELYVRAYPGPGPATPVSLEGGGSPAWHPTGRELFFVTCDSKAVECRLMAVEFAPGSPPRLGRPRLLFNFRNDELVLFCIPSRCYDVARDGQRFYAVQRQTLSRPPPVTHVDVVLNWFEELKAKVPSGTR